MFKEEARNLRERLLDHLTSEVAGYLRDACYQYFRKQTNQILAEIEEERDCYLQNLFNPLNLMFTLITAGSILPSRRFTLDDIECPRNQLSLQTIQTDRLEVTLCFGDVTIPIRSKIKFS